MRTRATGLEPATSAAPKPVSPATGTLVACFLAMFTITLDAVVVNVALPAIRTDLGGGITGLQWVVDGYTLLFAALLLSAGALSDRLGARTALSAGTVGFAMASAGCALAPTLPILVTARVMQGATAAVVMPASMSLLGQVFRDPAARARAVGVWAMGGAAASTSGPLLGGLLILASWRLVFVVNVPVGVLVLTMLRRPSPRSGGTRGSTGSVRSARWARWRPSRSAPARPAGTA